MSVLYSFRGIEVMLNSCCIPVLLFRNMKILILFSVDLIITLICTVCVFSVNISY